nr:MAG TPA: hypothetical protein [Caudoviricetes sp.]
MAEAGPVSSVALPVSRELTNPGSLALRICGVYSSPKFRLVISAGNASIIHVHKLFVLTTLSLRFMADERMLRICARFIFAAMLPRGRVCLYQPFSHKCDVIGLTVRSFPVFNRLILLGCSHFLRRGNGFSAVACTH